MNQSEINKQRHKVLKAVEKQFNEALVPARLSGGAKGNEEDNIIAARNIEVLTVMMEDLASAGTETVGEFFFVPSGPDDQVQIFNNVLTIETEIREETKSQLMEAAFMLNAAVPVGAFAIDMSRGNLIYRHAYELPLPVSEEQLAEAVDLSMGTAVDVVRGFGYIMQEIASGQRSIESVKAMLYSRES